jgi:hypothetical protein
MKKKRIHQGQTLIEFALLLPVFLVLIIGFLDLGRAVFYYSALSNAVRESTRYAISQRNLSEDDIKDKVIEYAFALQNTPNPLESDDITISYPLIEHGINMTISIKATYTFLPVTPFIAPSGIDLVVQSTMRISGAAR